MYENLSVISECDNLEIENYLKSCGSYPKNTEIKFVDNHGEVRDHRSRDVGGLIQYSKYMLNSFRQELEDSELPDIDKHIIIEKDRLNELLKTKIKEYLRDNPQREVKNEKRVKIVQYKEKPKPLVRNVRRVKSFDRHIHCVGNKKPTKPVFVSRKSQQIHENNLKTLKVGRNIVIDPCPVTSYYPRRIFNNTKLASKENHGPTWHDRLLAQPPYTSEGDCTIVTTTTTSQVIKKSEIKVLRYNYDWGKTDTVSNESTAGGKQLQSIDQTTQTENKIVTTKSVECYTEQLCEIEISPKLVEDIPIIEPSTVHVSSYRTDENVQVTVGSSFVYEYESTFDESSSDSELSETVKPQLKSTMLVPTTLTPKKTNILLETVVYDDKKLEQCDAEIQTEFEPIRLNKSPIRIKITTNENDVTQKDVELELSRLDEEIMQDKFKLLSVLRHSPRNIQNASIASQSLDIFSHQCQLNVTPPSTIQLQLTPLKPCQAMDFMPSPLELSSIRPLSLAHKNTTFDTSNEKYWKTINKIQMDAARKPFSPKLETDQVAKRAAEIFLKSTGTNTNQAIEPERQSSTTSSYVSNVLIVTTSSSEVDSDSTISSRNYPKFRRTRNSGKISDGEVLSLGEVRKFSDDSE